MLFLLGIILFSASMAIPALYNSKWRDPMQGGAAGLMVAAILSIVPIILLANRNKGK